MKGIAKDVRLLAKVMKAVGHALVTRSQTSCSIVPWYYLLTVRGRGGREFHTTRNAFGRLPVFRATAEVPVSLVTLKTCKSLLSL